jgi:hypothetical protein
MLCEVGEGGRGGGIITPFTRCTALFQRLVAAPPLAWQHRHCVVPVPCAAWLIRHPVVAEADASNSRRRWCARLLILTANAPLVPLAVYRQRGAHPALRPSPPLRAAAVWQPQVAVAVLSLACSPVTGTFRRQASSRAGPKGDPAHLPSMDNWCFRGRVRSPPPAVRERLWRGD